MASELDSLLLDQPCLSLSAPEHHLGKFGKFPKLKQYPRPINLPCLRVGYRHPCLGNAPGNPKVQTSLGTLHHLLVSLHPCVWEMRSGRNGEG